MCLAFLVSNAVPAGSDYAQSRRVSTAVAGKRGVSPVGRQHRAQVVEGVDLGPPACPAPARHARKAQRDAGLVARAFLDALEGDLEDQFGRTCRTGPKRCSVFLRTQAVISRNSASVRPE
jgi:hypothetical protein